jgi:cysteine-rich repeat protein
MLLGCNPGNITEAPDTGATSSESSEDCPSGTLGCACAPVAKCEPGLECVDGVCAEPDPGETGECSSLGCDCVDDEGCDEELWCFEGGCIADECGDGNLDPGEVCDDANLIEGDGCDNDCTYTRVLELALGGVHTCALIEQGRIRCWGHNGGGQLGYGINDDVGNDETPSSAGDLPLPAAVDIEAGGAHSCAVFENGDVRCWGFNTSGQLGLGNSAMTSAIGDDETLEGLPKIDLIAPANEVGVGVLQTCARVVGQLRCWGAGAYGQLGLAGIANIGDDEVPLAVPAVMLGGEPVRLSIGGSHGCAIMANGTLRCWGRNDTGQLGLGHAANVGDNEHPGAVPEVDVISPMLPSETSIVDIAAGLGHSCALLSSGDVVCWGAGTSGQLGQGSATTWGDNVGEVPSSLRPIQIGGPAVALAVGYVHSCVILEGGSLRCWGSSESGQLGHGDEEFVGLSNLPLDRPVVALPQPVVFVAAGGAHTCVVFEDQQVSCWGSNQYGQLGYGHTDTIGDDEPPMIAGYVKLL